MFLKTMQGWTSSHKLIHRQSIVTAGIISTANNLDKGFVRIGSLCEDGVDGVRIDEETISEITSTLILKLRQNGMPFLNRVTAGSVTSEDLSERLLSINADA